ncbi:hypothetical protein B0T24DRAFT_603203 [Lasiosphaeria ovina]|uniref:Uncharacterized protein n=1 Tax=Lasiosphaeria ovina TaxID=92902 RepID=A0AAE0NK32_9PEZI|nr:hypothetical protein B0T24DRAFT_603203 [Lasiosphaeria ovina]
MDSTEPVRLPVKIVLPTSGTTLHRTLCFYHEPLNGDLPRYIAETSDAPGIRNYAHHRATMTIQDIRGRESDFTLPIHSFAALPGAFSGLNHPTSGNTHAIDFNDDLQVSTSYITHVKALLLDYLPRATEVVVFDYTIRKASATKTAARQVRKIHIDQSPEGALRRARRHLDQKTAALISSGAKRFSIINVWKSIKETVTDHPLTFADCRSLCQSDLVPVTQIYPDYIGETYALRNRSTQVFWY